MKNTIENILHRKLELEMLANQRHYKLGWVYYRLIEEFNEADVMKYAYPRDYSRSAGRDQNGLDGWLEYDNGDPNPW